MPADIAAVILAAGLSSRMTGFKPLLDLDGRHALERCVSLFQDVSIEDVVVVTGREAEQVSAAARRLGARAVHNPDFREGMFGSVRAGVAALQDRCAGFFLLPVDIPLVRRETVRCLLEALQPERNETLIPHFQGQSGHPPLIPASLRPAILATSGDQGGLRSVLQRAEIRAVPVPDKGVLLDMDTDQDLQRIRQRLQRFGLPEEQECEALLDWHKTPQRVREHGRAVACAALAMARALPGELDMHLVERAALLHDLAKGARQHEAEGGRILEAWEFHEVAGIVAAHRDMHLPDEAPLTECEVVFLADKLVQGARAVPIARRYGAVLERHGHDPEARKAIEGRRERALAMLARVQRELPPDSGTVEELVQAALCRKTC